MFPDRRFCYDGYMHETNDIFIPVVLEDGTTVWVRVYVNGVLLPKMTATGWLLDAIQADVRVTLAYLTAYRVDTTQPVHVPADVWDRMRLANQAIVISRTKTANDLLDKPFVFADLIHAFERALTMGLNDDNGYSMSTRGMSLEIYDGAFHRYVMTPVDFARFVYCITNWVSFMALHDIAASLAINGLSANDMSSRSMQIDVTKGIGVVPRQISVTQVLYNNNYDPAKSLDVLGNIPQIRLSYTCSLTDIDYLKALVEGGTHTDAGLRKQFMAASIIANDRTRRGGRLSYTCSLTDIDYLKALVEGGTHTDAGLRKQFMAASIIANDRTRRGGPGNKAIERALALTGIRSDVLAKGDAVHGNYCYFVPALALSAYRAAGEHLTDPSGFDLAAMLSPDMRRVLSASSYIMDRGFVDLDMAPVTFDE